MAENKVSVEITLEEKAALKALTQLTKEVQKTETGFTKLGKTGDESLGILGEASKGLTDGFSSFVKGVTVANLASAAIIGTGRAIKDFVSGSVQAAVDQENAINRLNQALMSSGDFSRSASDELQAFASALQQNSKFGDEVVIGQLAIAKSFGATNEQAKQLVQAAANLAATMGGSLEERVQQLGKTFTGTGGRLDQLIPGFKNLTEEQLKSGAAFEFVNQKFSGAAANELNTYEGKLTSLKNAASDFQEELGTLIITSDGVQGSIGFLSDIFQQLTKDLYAARVASKVQAEGYTESREELVILYEKQEQLNLQLQKYQQIANSKGLDLRTLNDAKTNVESLRAELLALNSTISISSSAIQRDEDKPVVAKAAGGSLTPEDQKIVDSRSEAYAQLQVAYVEQAAWEAEQDLLKRDITTENYAAELEQLVGIEQAKVDAKFAAEEQKARIITDAQTKQYTLQKLQADKELALETAKANAKKKIDDNMLKFQQQNQQANAQIMAAGFGLAAAIAKDGSKEQFLIQKAGAIAQAIVATQLGAAQALALGPILGPPLAAKVSALGAINVATIIATAIKGYEQGGIIPGTSTSGDRVMARVNSGEMILNRQQQTQLFNMANGDGGGNVAEEIRNLARAIMDQPINLVVDGRQIATVVRREVQSGFRLS